MKYTLNNLRSHRILKSVFAGFAAGAVILCAYLTPLALRNSAQAAAAAIRQENLTSARGEAYDSFAMAKTALTVLLDGKPHENMSVAADRGYWTVPQDGEINLSLAPGFYEFTAGFENRSMTLSGEVHAGRENTFVLDVNKAPSAPEFQLFEIPEQEDAAISLEITGANEVTSENLPVGVSIAKRDGSFVLLYDENELTQGVYCMRLVAENEYGQAFSYICLRGVRDKAVTPVYTPEDLDGIRDDLSGQYLLMNDIDMSAVDNWIPIGTESYPFTGVFDGGGREITGFHAPEQIAEGVGFALFDYVKNAELRNVIFRQPVITPEVPARDLGGGFRCSVFAAIAIDSLIENCGSFGGIVSPGDGWAGGLFVSILNSVALGCYNSTDVICSMANSYLPNTGGIAGGISCSYIANCANEGEIKGNHLSGGIAGHGSNSDLVRCINSGYIWGSTIVGAVPAGGIIQSNDNGSISNCCFVRGQSAIGAHSNGGYVTAVLAVTDGDLRQPQKLSLPGFFDGDTPRWAYASLDAKGPVPYGIFKEKAPSPALNHIDGRIEIPPADGGLYFYTLDGGDPYANCAEPATQLSINLQKGQTLTIFAAKQGFRDSEIIRLAGD